MNTNKVMLAVTAALFVALAACGPEGGRGAAAGAGRSNPDKPVASAPCPPTGKPSDGGMWRTCRRLRPTGPRFQVVKPRPGMADVRPIPWLRATGRGRAVLVRYYSGVEPCSVLDHIDVAETPKRVVITLYEGRDPAGSGTCIEIAMLKAVKVTLARPVGGRTIVNGAPENHPTSF